LVCAGPQGKTGAKGETGNRGAKWYTFALDQTDPIASALSNMTNIVTDKLVGDYILDSVSGNVYILTSLTTIEYLCNIKGTQADIMSSVTPFSSLEYVLERKDRNTILVSSSASSQKIIIPTTSSVPFDLGTMIVMIQGNTGSLSVEASSGVTLSSVKQPVAYAKGSVLFLFKVDVNNWVLSGDLKYVDLDIVLDAANVGYDAVSPVLIFENNLV
jgi:hypothetical protein